MKKPIDYLSCVNSLTTREDLYNIGKQIQIDAIEETCRICAESVKMKMKNNVDELHMNDEWMEIDKQSILSVADRLKKELDDSF